MEEDKDGLMPGVRCRHCGWFYNRPAGYRNTVTGRKKLYCCMNCKKKFTPDTAFLGMKNDPEIIIQCLDLYLSGLSLRAVSQHMRRRGIKLSHMCIYRWIRKYSRMLKRHADSFVVNGQDAHLNADEMMVQLNGRWVWLWNIIERENRFVLASRFSNTREMVDAKALFREAKSKMDGLPMRITTDGMPAYPRAIRGSFQQNRYPRVEHFQAPGITARRHNNLVERHHNTIRQRIKTMRGFHEMGSASDIMNMWHVYFNYMRPNAALNGKTPSESAGLGKHDLREMIEVAYEHGK